MWHHLYRLTPATPALVKTLPVKPDTQGRVKGAADSDHSSPDYTTFEGTLATFLFVKKSHVLRE